MSIDPDIEEISESPGTLTPTGHRDMLGLLPDGLLLQLFEILGQISKGNLCNISRLNKRYHKLGDAVLYKNVLLETPELHLTFSESLGRRPRRGSAIYEVQLAYPSSQLAQLHLEAPIKPHSHPSNSLSRMTNLEKLDIALPDVLLHGIGSLFNGPFDLACLKTCSLFYQCADDAYWDLRENIHIFTLPTLETLTIRKAKLDERGFDFLERPTPTDLKKLHLIDCDINDDGLSDVLEFPVGLEEFVMTHAEEPDPELEESSDNFSDYMAALNSQAHALRSVTINSPSLGGRKVLRLRNFTAMTSLRMDWDHQLFGMSSKRPRLHSVGLPPHLEVLEFFDVLGQDEEVTDLLLNMVQIKNIIASNWKQLIVVESPESVLRDLRIACTEQGLELVVIGGASGIDSDQDE